MTLMRRLPIDTSRRFGAGVWKNIPAITAAVVLQKSLRLSMADLLVLKAVCHIVPSKDLVVPADLYETSLEALDSGGGPPRSDRRSRETCRTGGYKSPPACLWFVIGEHVSDRLHHSRKYRCADRSHHP